MYIEGEVPYVSGNGYNNGWGGNGDWWAIVLLAALFGWGGNGGYGFGGFGGRGFGGSEVLGYELGKVATTNDVASGFNNSAVLGSLNDIKLGQSQMQNWINQGFAGINTQLLSGFHGVDNSICTLGYQSSQLANGLSRELANCCCDLKSSIADVKYANEKQTCDIIGAITAGNQRLIDMYTSDKIDTLNRKLATAEAQLSNNAQSRYITDTILDKLSPCPKPAYITCNPNTGLTYPAGYTQANFGGSGCCGCGSF